MQIPRPSNRTCEAVSDMQHLWSIVSIILCATLFVIPSAGAQTNPETSAAPSFQDPRRAPAGSLEVEELSARLKTAEARRAQAEALARRLAVQSKDSIAKAKAAREAEVRRREIAEADAKRANEAAKQANAQIEKERETARAARIEAVKAAIAQHKDAVAKLRKDLDDALKRASDADEQRKQAGTKLAKLEQSIARLTSQARRSASVADELRKSAEQAEISRKAAVAARQIAEQRAALRDKQAQEKAKAAETRHKAEKAQVASDIAKLRRQLTHVQEALQRGQTERESEVKRLAKTLAKTLDRAKVAEAAVAEHKSALERHVSEVAALEKKLLAAQRALQKVRDARTSDAAGHTKKIAEALRQAKKAKAAVARLEAEEQQQEAAVKDLQQQLKQAQQALRKSEAGRQDDASRHAAKLGKVRQTAKEVARLTAQLKDTRTKNAKQIEQLKRDIERLQLERTKARKLAQAAEQRVKGLETALAAAQRRAARQVVARPKPKTTAKPLSPVDRERRRIEQAAQRELERLQALYAGPNNDKGPETVAGSGRAGAQPKPPTSVALAAKVPGQVGAPAASCGNVEVSTRPLPAGQMRLELTSKCRAGQRVSLRYAGVTFVRAFDNAGYLGFTLDCFAGAEPGLQIAFEDRTTKNVPVVAQDLKAVTKIALIWQAGINLDLHAYEYAAKHGSRGHIWAEAAGSLEASFVQTKNGGRGHGFMSITDDGKTSGDHVEVYTFWHKTGQKFGLVTTAVDYNTRGDIPEGETCGNGEHANVAYQSVIRTRKGKVSMERGTIAGIACGTRLSVLTRYIRAAVRDLRIR